MNRSESKEKTLEHLLAWVSNVQPHKRGTYDVAFAKDMLDIYARSAKLEIIDKSDSKYAYDTEIWKVFGKYTHDTNMHMNGISLCIEKKDYEKALDHHNKLKIHLDRLYQEMEDLASLNKWIIESSIYVSDNVSGL